ncbi:photosynthetic protein synthase I [Bacillus sp. LL01]|uniref:SCO family protein n=1 Tax=Bacillus sp. LL01 TaxID=1665556 RepID=UPI00064D1311|nr:SCO family protein [Bacillus sp. LL01]KMJ59651.1 photosynthetic protein synthase I [Bacillus sp. LL01]
MRKNWRLLLIGLCTIILASCSANSEIPDTTDWELANFQYINQENEEFGLEDMKGDITVANMVFTNCTTVCSPMTANMARLQRMVEEKKLDAHFLSFSVDPEVDSPEVLKEFGENFQADFSTWNFLTGYSQKEIEKFGPKNFKTIVAKPKNGGEVVHGTSIYLINQEGIIIKSYNGLDVPYEEVLEHIKILQNQ